MDSGIKETKNHKKQAHKMSTRELCFMAMFTALIAICAQINIPLPGGVPFTLQIWAVSLAGLVLGPKNGALTVLVYVLLGAVGAPVFARFTGGIGTIMRPTGGFILTFPIVALIVGLGERKGGLLWVVLSLVIASIVNFGVGLFWFNWVTELGLLTSFGYAVAPFLIVEVVRIPVLPFAGRSIKASMRKARMMV